MRRGFENFVILCSVFFSAFPQSEDCGRLRRGHSRSWPHGDPDLDLGGQQGGQDQSKGQKKPQSNAAQEENRTTARPEVSDNTVHLKIIEKIHQSICLLKISWFSSSLFEKSCIQGAEKLLVAMPRNLWINSLYLLISTNYLVCYCNLQLKQQYLNTWKNG